MKRLVKILVWLIPLVAAAFVLANVFGTKKEKGLKISDTPAIVTEIRALSNLTTAVFYNEVVLTQKKSKEVLGNTVPYVQDEICLIAKGKVRAGIDLSKITGEDLLARGDTLEFRLPDPEIFEVVVNPSDYEIFVEDGKWSHEEVVALESRAADRIRREALKSGILQKAGDSAKNQVRRILETLGFKEVVFVPSGLCLPADE